MLRFRLGSMAEGQTRRSNLVSVVAMLATLCVPAGGSAEQPPGEDYAPSERSWNGLSDFAALARAEGMDVVATQKLDWQELRPTDVVFPPDLVRRRQPRGDLLARRGTDPHRRRFRPG